MKLCRHCTKELPDGSNFCPHCGQPQLVQPPRPKRGFWSEAQTLGGILSRVFFVSLIAGMVLYTGMCGYIGMSALTGPAELLSEMEEADSPELGAAGAVGSMIGMGVSALATFIVWAVGMVVLALLALIVKPRRPLGQ